MRLRLLCAAAVATTLVPLTGAHAAPPVQDKGTEVIPGDVFVVDGGVLKNPSDQTPPDAQLYNIVGTSLGLTWGQWGTAGGSALAHAVGNKYTDVALSLHGLVPGGVYSVFYLTFGPDSVNPACPNAERSLPLPHTNDVVGPDQASFVADSLGNAAYPARASGNLLAATIVEYVVIYHDDGVTYGDVPNRGEDATRGPNCRSSFGTESHRQLLVLQQFP